MAGDRTPPQGERPPEGSSWPVVACSDRRPSLADAARRRVWRPLTRLRALSLQQGVFILPGMSATAAALACMVGHVADVAGTTHRLPLGSLPPEEEVTLVAGFGTQRTCQNQASSGAARRAQAADCRAHGAAPLVSAARTRGRARPTDAGQRASGGEAS